MKNCVDLIRQGRCTLLSVGCPSGISRSECNVETSAGWGTHDLFQGLAATTDHDAWTLSFCSDDLMENMWSKQWKYLKASTNCEAFTRKEMRCCTVDGRIWYYMVGCMFHGVAVSTEVELHHQRLRVVSPLS